MFSWKVFPWKRLTESLRSKVFEMKQNLFLSNLKMEFDCGEMENDKWKCRNGNVEMEIGK